MAAFRKYPNLVRALVNRAKHYNQVLECIEWEEEGSVFVIRPEIPAVSRLEKDEEKLREFYQHGYDQMKANFEALQEISERRIKLLYKRKEDWRKKMSGKARRTGELY